MYRIPFLKRGLGCGVIFVLLAAGLLQAAQLPHISDALTRWSGTRQVLLRSDLSDPLESPVVQELLDIALELGFVVLPADRTTSADEGLVADLRSSPQGTLLVLSRAEDGAIFAMDRLSGKSPGLETPTPLPASTAQAADSGAQNASSPAVAVPAQPLTTARPAPIPKVPVESSEPLMIDLAEAPAQIAVVRQTGVPGTGIVLQYPDRLEIWTLHDRQFRRQSSFRPPMAVTRALYLGAGDLDGDGQDELAAVWGSDEQGIYQATRTNPHAWVLELAGGQLTPASSDLQGYLRVLEGRLYLQRAGGRQAFGPGVHAVASQSGEYRVDPAELAWAGRDLYAATPLDERLALAWNDDQRPVLVDRQSGAQHLGKVVMRDFGRHAGPTVAVPLANPEYRSGWGKEDIVRQQEIPLRRRVVRHADKVYTLMFGRDPGLPLLGQASGEDRLVAQQWAAEGLDFAETLLALEAFMVDFALLDERNGEPGAVALVNEQKNGQGKAYLAITP